MINEIIELKQTPVGRKINQRLQEFKSNDDWFSELCFCLLTANWKAKESIELQKELAKEGFCKWNEKTLAKFLKKKGHRFWPQRAERIVLARKYLNIKEILNNVDDKREWLVSNIKGLGYKEASHFLRNIGYFDYAILDRHILSVLEKDVKSLTRKKYLEIEEELSELCSEVGMVQGELDLYLFYIKTGEVLK